jgi:hypothetical protein
VVIRAAFRRHPSILAADLTIDKFGVLSQTDHW